MTKIALILAIAAVGEGAVALHLVNQLHQERENTQALQARVSELESKAPQPAASATFIAVPQTVSPFTMVQKVEPAPAAAGVKPVKPVTIPNGFVPMPAPDQESMREQIKANMDRQRALLRDPEYREAMLAQQKMGIMQSNPNVGRDLDLTAEQVDRLFDTLAEQQMHSMEDSASFTWGEQPDQAKMQEFQRKAMEQRSANEAEIKRVLGETKFREWQEYQTLAGVRWEADRWRTSLASAGVPLDESVAKPLLKTLAEQQQKMIQELAKTAPASNRSFASAGGGPVNAMMVRDAAGTSSLQIQEQSLEFIAQHQKRQREALARVLTPEQLKVVEDQQNAELQMQRAQLKMMRAQQEAGLLDPQGNVGYIQEGVSFAPTPSD